MSITEQEMREFVGKFFPSKELNYASDECIQIQAGEQFGIPMHYEYHLGTVALHLEQKDWRAIRNHLNANLHNERLIPSNWFGRNNCQWTIDGEIHTVHDMFQAFLDIRSIIEPVIEQFEGKEPQDYSHYTLDESERLTTESKTPVKTQEEINLTLLADKEMVVLYDTKIANIQFVSAALCGGWIGTSVIPEVCQVKRNADEMTVQMHLYADNYCKGVQLLLKQNGDDIYGKIEWAKGTKRRAERNARIEKILQSDWNDTSDADVANLDTNIPIGKKGYGVEKIIVEIKQLETHSEKDDAHEKTMKPTEIEKKNPAGRNMSSVTIQKKEEKSQKAEETVKITPFELPPVTIERKIDQLGITLTKTYNKFAEAPIQGIDTAGRKTKNVFTPKLPTEKVFDSEKLQTRNNISNNLTDFVKKCFQSIKDKNPTSYKEQFWKYLSSQDSSKYQIETGYTLKSTFGIISVIPTFKHTVSASVDSVESPQPTFAFDERYCESDLTPDSLVTLFAELNAEEISNDEIIFSSSKYNNVQTIVGSFKTPKSFDNTCPDCLGEKIIRCNWCGGSGREQYEEGEYADGRPKIKTGQCNSCYGRGYHVCKACNETGKIDQGTGMIQVLENAEYKLRLKRQTITSNTFFSTDMDPDSSEIQEIGKQSKNAENNREKKKRLKEELETCCEELIQQIKDIDFEDGDFVFTNTIEIKGRNVKIDNLDFSKIDNAEYLLWDWEKCREKCDLPSWRYTDCGVKYKIDELEKLEQSSKKQTQKINNLYQNLFDKEDVEVIFKNQSEISYDNQHKRLLHNNVPKDKIEFLYNQNLQKAQDVFNLANPNDRILAILEKNEIKNLLLKIIISIDQNKKFEVYYSQYENKLYYQQDLPKIQAVVDQVKLEEELEYKRQEEQRKIEESKRIEEARLREKKRMQKYSQSMDTLLSKKNTKKMGMFSKLFNTKSFKDAIDAEKTIKLLIYIAKADGKLDIDEKEYLTRAILNQFVEAYTTENRQRFIDMLDSDSLPELTKEDVKFSSTEALNKAIIKMEKIAAIGGISPKEKELLERVHELAGINK